MNGIFIHEKQKFRSRAFQRFSTWTYIFIYTRTQFSRYWIKLRRRKRFDIHLLTKMGDIVQVTLQRSEICGLRPKTAQRSWQQHRPPVVSRQCVVYQFKCDLCDTDYIGYATRHLHQRIEEHRTTAVGAHVKGCHGISNPELLKQFSQGKLDCLIREMLFIRMRKPKLNTQSNSIRAKVFV